MLQTFEATIDEQGQVYQPSIFERNIVVNE